LLPPTRMGRLRKPPPAQASASPPRENIGGFVPLGRHRGISDSRPDYRDVLPTIT
jgi:hypothetical protein